LQQDTRLGHFDVVEKLKISAKIAEFYNLDNVHIILEQKVYSYIIIWRLASWC